MNYSIDAGWSGTIQVTDKYYETKPTDKEYAGMRFNETTVTCQSLSDIIYGGYSFCPTDRKLDKVECSNFVFIDIDGSYLPMDEVVSLLSDKPSLCYTTPSDGDEKKSFRKYKTPDRKYRFRFVYALDRPTYGICQYDAAFEYIVTSTGLGEILPSDCIDVLQPNQLYNGSYHCNIINNDLIYSLPDYIYKMIDLSSGECSCLKTVSNEVRDAFMKSRTNRDFIYWFLSEYGDPNLFTETPYDGDGEIEGMKVLTKEYLVIPRKYWYYDKESHKRVYGKWKDGEGRHRKLYLTGLILRRLNEGASTDEIFFEFVRTIRNHYDIMNSDGSIKYTRERILSEFENIMKVDIETFKVKKEMKHSSFKVDDCYCAMRGVSKKKVLCEILSERKTIRKYERYNRITEVLPREVILKKTDKECLSILRENGIDISIRSFKNYREEIGISRNKKCKT